MASAKDSHVTVRYDCTVTSYPVSVAVATQDVTSTHTVDSVVSRRTATGYALSLYLKGMCIGIVRCRAYKEIDDDTGKVLGMHRCQR